jgi:hypothetical protein
VPYYGTFEELSNILSLANTNINESQSPREIIFESWVLFDFLIRKLLLKAFELDKYENENYDPMYDYLPQSLDNCLKNLEKLLLEQRNIYKNRLHPDTVREYPIISMPGAFISFLNKKKVTNYLKNLLIF